MLRGIISAWSVSAFVVLAGCSDASITSVTGNEGDTVTVMKWAGDAQTATVGSAVTVPPSVRIVMRNGMPVADVPVSFEVSAGGGSVTGGDAVTNADGIATVAAWVLGEHPGANTLSAKVDSATTLVFTAAAVVGPSASITKTAGDDQDGWVADILIPAPTVRVEDVFGNPVPGITVIFAVATGGGEVTLGAAQATDASGVARVGAWRLGTEPGTNTLNATVVGLPPVLFTAHAVNGCADPMPYAFGSTVDGSLTSGSCRLWSGEYSDRYSATASDAASVRLEVTSPDAWPQVSLFDATGTALASEWFYCDDLDYCPGGGTISTRVLLAPGDYVVAASLFGYDYSDRITGGVGGSYELSSTSTAEDVQSCSGERVFIVPGVTTTQRVESTDCKESYTFLGSTFDYYLDRFDIYLKVDETYTISMSSAEFDTYLAVGGFFNDDFGLSTDSRITFTPHVSGMFEIQAATSDAGVTGSYTLTVEQGG